jgi:hypothetical protein
MLGLSARPSRGVNVRAVHARFRQKWGSVDINVCHDCWSSQAGACVPRWRRSHPSKSSSLAPRSGSSSAATGGIHGRRLLLEGSNALARRRASMWPEQLPNAPVVRAIGRCEKESEPRGRRRDSFWRRPPSVTDPDPAAAGPIGDNAKLPRRPRDGQNSSGSVLISRPRLTGGPQESCGLRRSHSRLSRSPKPPSRAEAPGEQRLARGTHRVGLLCGASAAEAPGRATCPCSRGPRRSPRGRCRSRVRATWRRRRSAPCCCCRVRSRDRRM